MDSPHRFNGSVGRTVILAIAVAAIPSAILASDAGDVSACKAALAKSGAEEVTFRQTTFTIDDQRILLGNADNAGFLCIVRMSGVNHVVSHLETGLDTVGKITDAAKLDVRGRTFVDTVQLFRGGSNSVRQFRDVYSITGGKARKVLELPVRKELAIGEYWLAERNATTWSKAGLSVSQDLLISRAPSRSEAVLYRSRRAFRLTFVAELSAFVEGAGTCVQDLVVDKTTWLKSGQRFGYIFQPGLADGTGLTIKLVRADGSTTVLRDLADLAFLRIEGSST
jgi:hypothetical protein